MSDPTDSVVVSIGGSILVPGNNDSEYIARLAEMLKGLADGTRLAVVCGGGKTARYYAEVGGALGGDTYQLDILGIGATRLNAQLLSLALGDMPDRVPETVEETAEKAAPGRIAVMGGTEPGHTTDAVAAMVAKAMKADRIVNASNVDAVYSADPRADPDAVRYERMTIAQLKEVVYQDHDAGKSSVLPVFPAAGKKNFAKRLRACKKLNPAKSFIRMKISKNCIGSPVFTIYWSISILFMMGMDA